MLLIKYAVEKERRKIKKRKKEVKKENN